MGNILSNFLNFGKEKTSVVDSFEKEEVANPVINQDSPLPVETNQIDSSTVFTELVEGFTKLVVEENIVNEEVEALKFEETALGFIIENGLKKVYFYRDLHEAYKRDFATEHTIATPPMQITKEEYLSMYQEFLNLIPESN
jgi:hypothetical protein